MDGGVRSMETTEESHECKGRLPHGGYGEALDECYEDEDNKLWVSNGEYASQVNYCPYCGYKAKHQNVVPITG